MAQTQWSDVVRESIGYKGKKITMLLECSSLTLATFPIRLPTIFVHSTNDFISTYRRIPQLSIFAYIVHLAARK